MHWEAMLGELVRTRRTALLAYAYLFALNRAEAEDLVQEALVRTFGRSRSFADVRSAEAYVRQAIRTSYLDAARRGAGWTARRHLLVGLDGCPSPDDTAVAGIDVRAALAALPARERACVVLRHMDDLPVAEIAHQLRLSEGAVKRYLSDGSRTLRDALGDGVRWPERDDTTIPVLSAGEGSQR